MDEADLAAAVSRHLGGDATVDGLRRLSGGASRETWAFDATHDGQRLPLVLRRDPAPTSVGPLDRSTEADVLRAAHDAGVRAPSVRFVLGADDGLGAGFVMDRIEGETVARRILRDDAYAARAPASRPRGRHAGRGDPRRPDRRAPFAARARAHRAARPVSGGARHVRGAAPRLRARAAAPRPRRAALDAPRLVHGDFRNGNLVVGPDGLRAVLDWELAHLGDPVEDLGWLCVKSWRFGVSDRRVGGFGDVDALRAGYGDAGGEPVDAARLDWWEAFGTLKWGVICEVQAQTHLQGVVRSVELATLGRRIAEMEWDLLELLDPGAPEPAANADVARPAPTLQDRPSAAELVAAVREFLERDVLGTVEERVRFHTRVAVNALGMVERELALGGAPGAQARDELAAFLGSDGDLEALLTELAARIRRGVLDDDPAVVALTRGLVAAKLDVSNPRYRTGAPR